MAFFGGLLEREQTMRFWTAVCLCVAILCPALAWGDEVATLIAGIQGKYGKAKDLTVDFEQVVVVKQMGNREQRASGTIYFARPNKMRWVYKSSPAKEIISDGTSLVLYYVEEKKAYLRKTAGNYNIGLPMAVLAGDVDVKTQYTPELLADENGVARLKLTPKKPLGFDYLVLRVNRQTSLVEGAETVDAYGNVTKLTLKNPRFNGGLASGLFTFTPKPGVEVIDSPMMELE
jgi:outer membrane lipoprotein carrier protein